MKDFFLIFVVKLFVAAALFSCDDEDTALQPDPRPITSAAELTVSMEELVNKNDVPGFAITIVKDNTIVYQEAFGYADVQAQKPYTNQTVQHIASTSKTFVAAAVVKAIEQGYFTLETEINDILPVPVVNPKHANVAIQVKHLVTHTSGLLDNPAFYLAENYYILPGENISTPGAATLMNDLGIDQREGRSLEEFLGEYYLENGDMHSPDNFADTAPGTSWSYSNVATGLTGYLIEAATGQNFADYVKVNVLEPLGMSNSTYDISQVNRSNMAKWYLDKSTPFPLYANDSYPEGSLFTSNIDLGKYLQDMIDGSQGLSNTLFPESGYDLLFDDQLAAGTIPTDFADNHGIFWIKKDGKLQHGGNSFGVSTYLEVDPVDGSGYSLITNMDAIFDTAKYNQVASRVDQIVRRFLEAH